MRIIRRITVISALAVAALLSAGYAYAYVGPGPGLTVLGALWAVIAAVALALFAFIRWPLMYLLRKLRGPRQDSGAAGPDERPAAEKDTGE